jgi:DNA-binding PadR family transcriptional regulator
MREDEGLIKATESDGKRVFEITEAGTTVLAERKDTMSPWDMVAKGMSGDAMALRQAMMQTGAAAMQAGTAGSSDQVGRVVEVLDEARKRIYGILAEDAPTGE